MQGKKILITGGSGLVGSHIADQLAQLGAAQIVCVDNMVRSRRENLTWALQNGPVELVEGDIRDRELMDRLVAGKDLVFHQAALRITHCAAEPRQALEVMCDATFDLLEACVKHQVPKVVAASSASVYGLAQEFPTTENNNPYDNRTLYGAAKVFNEGLLRSFNDMYGLDYVALRYFNVYGPRMDIHGKYTEVMIRWMERISQGLPPLIFGSGDQTMDFIYIDDIARSNILAAQSQATDMVFNVASGTETSLKDLATMLIEVMGSGQKPEHREERSINPVSRRLADISAAKEHLGFEATVGLKDGLARLVEWWRTEKGI